MLAQFDNETFDWIYVDADHTYRGVKRDIEAAAPKIKKGGLIIFNDFARISRSSLGVFGVHQAVCEFAVNERWPFEYFCFQGDALYDVALKKPL